MIFCIDINNYIIFVISFFYGKNKFGIRLKIGKFDLVKEIK